MKGYKRGTLSRLTVQRALVWDKIKVEVAKLRHCLRCGPIAA